MSAMVQAIILEVLRTWPTAGTAPVVLNEATIAAHAGSLLENDVHATLELLKIRGFVDDCYRRTPSGDFELLGWMLTPAGK